MEKINWLTMEGYVEIVNENIIFKPDQIKYEPQNGQLVPSYYSYIISNILLENVEITFNVKMEEQTSRCQLVINIGNNDFLYIGINTAACVFGIMKRTNGFYQMLSSFGNLQTLNEDIIKNIDIKIKKNNYQIIVFANNIKIAETAYPVIKNPVGFYFESNNFF